MSNITCDFSAINNLATQLEKLGANVEKEQVEALKEARDYTNNKLRSQANKHIRTGQLAKSIVTKQPTVKNNIVSVEAGFDFDKGGWKSRFLLAETFDGTPNKQKDQEMWNILYSQSEKDKRKQIIENHLQKSLDEFAKK